MTKENLIIAPTVGLIRYSQKITFGINEKDIFEETYFEYRYKIFIEVTLKSFEDQTDKNFLLVIIHSESMPQKYQERFLSLELKYPFLKNYFLADKAESLRHLLKQTKNLIDFKNRIGITFRIDNDDAVPIDFIETLSYFAKPDYIGSCINLPKILIIKRIQANKYQVEQRYFPSNSIGLAYVTTEADFQTILDVAEHHLVNESYTLILLPKNSGMPIQTINGENAVNTINPDASVVLTEEELKVFLSQNKYGNVKLDCLNAFVENNEHNRFKNISYLLLPPVFKYLASKFSGKKNRT